MQYSNTTIFISRVYFCKKTTKESTSDTLSQIYLLTGMRVISSLLFPSTSTIARWNNKLAFTRIVTKVGNILAEWTAGHER
jgi:hypothetical protein